MDGVRIFNKLLAILAQLQADEEVLLAGLLVPLLEGALLDETRAAAEFGAGPLKLATELTRIGSSGIPAGWNPGEHLDASQAERLRKLLLSLASDVRLVLMRLALQLLRMRGLKGASPEETRRATLETREIYAPLANRLGIWPPGRPPEACGGVRATTDKSL